MALPVLTRVIDTHVHVWDYDAPWMSWLVDRPGNWDIIRKDFSWHDLRKQLDEADIAELMLVQASPDWRETKAYLELADQHDSIRGVVGWVTLQSLEATRSELSRLEGPGRGKLVGIRNNYGWEPDGEILSSPDVLDSCRFLADNNLTLDLHFRDQTELHFATALAQKLPDLTIIIDHLGKPLINAPQTFDQWATDIETLSGLRNVFMKYSGWATFLGRADADKVRKYVSHTLKTFGVERMMFASNWPVALVADSYTSTYHATIEALPDLKPDELEHIFRKTALRCYLGQ
ncbi:MAG: amidohydrolase family protein [Hyphomonas sp.]|nr:amidohydrolase family protein [Hyphomonas sp.]